MSLETAIIKYKLVKAPISKLRKIIEDVWGTRKAPLMFSWKLGLFFISRLRIEIFDNLL
jgi:hypothetical protein